MQQTKYPITYYTPAGGGNQYWQKANRVTLDPVWVVSSEELHHLRLTPAGALTVDPGSPFFQVLLRRADRQASRTMELGEVPDRYEGPVYQYLLEHQEHDTMWFDRGCPIIVAGAPATLEDSIDRPMAISAIQALYGSDQQYVPVGPQLAGPPGPEPSHLTGISFTNIPEHHNSNWAIAAATSITMQFTANPAGSGPTETHRVRAAFCLRGEPFDIQTSYIPGEITQQALEDSMVRGYFYERDSASWDDIKEDMSETSRRIWNLVTAAMEDPDKAFSINLEQFVNGFYPETPAPSRPITVRSRDGKITLTYDHAAVHPSL